jgi:hypothetical protein
MNYTIIELGYLANELKTQYPLIEITIDITDKNRLYITSLNGTTAWLNNYYTLKSFLNDVEHLMTSTFLAINKKDK